MLSRQIQRKRKSRGFTLIELLIVVAIIGLVASIIIPNLLDALQKAKQKRTLADMREVGGAWFSWLTDQVGAASAGQQVFDFDFGSLISAEALQSTLFPSSTFFYIQSVPKFDGWGGSFEYRLRAADLQDFPVMGIRSGGRDKSTSTDSYPVGPFISTDYDQDLVWVDGYFINYPAGSQTGNF